MTILLLRYIDSFVSFLNSNIICDSCDIWNFSQDFEWCAYTNKIDMKIPDFESDQFIMSNLNMSVLNRELTLDMNTKMVIRSSWELWPCFFVSNCSWKVSLLSCCYDQQNVTHISMNVVRSSTLPSVHYFHCKQ